jgi:carbon-monoxide dehydrogenase iron sulfur subunit
MMVVVNPSRCLGCRSCEVQCAVAHSKSKDIQQIIRDGEKPGHRISVEAFGRMAVPVHCQHCEEPACVLACPTGALERKADGKPVLADRERCIGCSMCVQACPFGVITMSPDGKGVLKCDMCIERLAQGIEPACVEACPTKALVFERAEDSNKEKRKKLAERLALAEDASKKSE